MTIGFGLKFNSSEVKLYSEVSYWPGLPVGVDAGLEIGNKNVETYFEGQTGIGLLGYSHGVYYRIPYSSKSYFGQRGKIWGGLYLYIAGYFDYTNMNGMFDIFVKRYYEINGLHYKEIHFVDSKVPNNE